MKVIILGAGEVGCTVARHLVLEANDITVVDTDKVLLKSLRERLKVRTVAGPASHPSVLLRAGIEDADLILAVTSDDEINMVACQVAYTLFRTPLRLARIRASSFLMRTDLFSPESVPIDFIINPEQRVTRAIQYLIAYPEASHILDFGGGLLKMVAVTVHEHAPTVGKKVSDLADHIDGAAAHVVAVYRYGSPIVLRADTVIEAEDELFFLAASGKVATVLQAFRPEDKANRRIMIVGGGNIGKQLAVEVEGFLHVKIIESDYARCRNLAETLHKAVILHGDASDADLLKAEDINNTDIFCALTNDDATNVLSAMLAKRLGARKVLALVNQTSYVNLAQTYVVDVAISPAQITIGALLEHIRRGDVVNGYTVHHGTAEVLEIVVHGDSNTSQVVGRSMKALVLPDGVRIAAIVRGKQCLFPRRDIVFESLDHVVVFLTDRKKVQDLERLFQVAVTFI